jgi:hypothetical protein
MASDQKPDVRLTASSIPEMNTIRPVSYTGPLMPRGAVNTQQTILVPDITKYVQTFIDTIFKSTKEEPIVEDKQIVPEGKEVVPEKTDMTDFSKKDRSYTDRVRELALKQDPYKRLFYDQCILEGCDPDTCYKKYIVEMS